MLTIYNNSGILIPEELKKKIQKLEIFDEVEEWNLLMAHYCLTVATKGSVLHNLLQCIVTPAFAASDENCPISHVEL